VGQYLVRRLVTMIVVFFLITIVVFALVHLEPGNPLEAMIPPTEWNSQTPALLAAWSKEYGLNEPLFVQYFTWMGRAFTGDFGYSIQSSQPVGLLIGQRIGPTLELMGVALVVGVLISLPLGMIAAVRKNTVIDYLASFVSTISISTPQFFIGILAIFVFSEKLGWFPSSGLVDPTHPTELDALWHLVLPALILAFSICGELTRYVRASTLSELSEDYVRTGIAKGLTKGGVVMRHVLRNAMIPVVTIVTGMLPGLLAGAVLIEQVFGWPGMGQLVVAAVGAHDYNIIIAFALMFAILVLFSNLLADILYALIDPRVRMS
jgi:ABC-type dipeptide/oligopeptide/nickel transport system permease component